MYHNTLGFRLFVCFSALILAAPLVARADVIYDNGGPDYRGGLLSDYGNTQQEADNFALQVGSETITDVHWWGAYSGGVAPDNFVIRIFADSSGVPGTQVGSDITVSNAHRAGTGNYIGGLYEAYTYSADFSPITLSAGPTYWISIVNNTSNGWFWPTSDVGSGTNAYRFSDGGSWYNTTGELAFNLTNDGVVPEPASLTLLGIGLAGLAGRKIRKRA